MVEKEEILADGMIIILGILILYSFFGLLIEKFKPPCGHEAAIIILIGLGISFFFYEEHDDKLQKIFRFDSDFFFIFCLPPIVFSSAYSMRRKVFF